MATDELSSKLSRRLQIEEGAEDPVAVDAPGQHTGSEEKPNTANANSELGAKLLRREELNEGIGEHSLPSMKIFNPYTEFKEFSRKQIKDMETLFKTYDAGKDNYIDLMELKLMMEKLGAPQTHIGLKMFELARDHLEDTGQYKVVRGIISPVGDAYKKKGLIEACHRLEMTRLATESSDWVMVDSWESLQPEWVETAKVVRHHYEELLAAEQNIDDVDTIKYAKKRRIEENHHKHRDGLQLMLLCGADVLESFGIPNMWKQEDIAEIVGRHGLVCITRSNSDPYKFIHQSDLLWKYRKNIHIVREWVTNDISATHVRRSLRRGQSVRYLLPDSVIHYIKEHDLYSSESEQKNADVVLAPLQRYTGASSS